MKHLVYCVLRNLLPARGILPAGIEGAPVFLVGEGGLAAACSEATDACMAATASRAMAYARAVEALHRVATVVPFRYGHFLDRDDAVRRLLGTHRAEFLRSLDAVEGCDEMGLRILLDDLPQRAGAGARPEIGWRAPAAARVSVRTGADSARHVEPSTSPGNGRSGHAALPESAGGDGGGYLAARRAQYAARARDAAAAARAIDQARGALEGLAVACRVEPGAVGDRRLASIVFLVRREFVECFREAFRRLEQTTATRALLTGPWPPYNFVGNPCAGGLSEPV